MPDDKLQFELDLPKLKKLVHEQFIDQMGDDGRRAVISKAIQLLTGLDEAGKRRNSWEDSPLEYAFKKHVSEIAHEAVGELIASDPTIREKIRAVAAEAIHDFLDNPETKTGIAGVLVGAFKQGIRR